MVQTWDPKQYLQFHSPRIRPALDLLAKIEFANPKTVYDLGCGPGDVTRLIQKKWPCAKVIGVDSSQEMLGLARERYPDITWVNANLRDWEPADIGDILFSNAVFHWIGSHDILLCRLLNYIRVGGVLAFQLPRNWNAPSHKIIREVVARSIHRDRLEPALLDDPVGSPEDYYDLLYPHVKNIDIWETEYLHELDGENAVAEWTRGSALKPLLDLLDEKEADKFYQEYSERINHMYPRRSDGKTLYRFRRLFVVARQ